MSWRMRKDAELSEELAAHLRMAIEERMEAGEDRERAEQTARREFGSMTAVREETRDTWCWTWLEHLGQDVRYAARAALRNRPFAATVVFSLALSIGANSAVFAVIDKLLLQELHVASPERLVTSDASVSWRFLRTLHDATDLFTDVAGIAVLDRYNVSLGPGAGAPGERRVALVSGNYFSTMGVSAVVGRNFAVEDDSVPGEQPVAVISYASAVRDFGSSQDAIGKMVRINDKLLRIVGVAAPDFSGDWIGRPIDFWVPAAMQSEVMREMPGLLTRSNGWLRIVARLRDHVSREQAQSAVVTTLRRFEIDEAGPRATPELVRYLAHEQLELVPMGHGYLTDRAATRMSLFVLLVMAGIVLLVTIADIANLQLARVSARQREMAVRTALGASRARLVRQLLTENVLLAIVGGVLGLFAAAWMSAGLSTISFGPVQMDSRAPSSWITLDAGINGPVVAFSAAVMLSTGVLFGLLPALRASKLSVAPSLTIRNAVGERRTVGHAIIAAQVALSLVLIVGAGLFVRSLTALTNRSLGIDKRHLLLVWTAPGQTGREGQALALFAQQAIDRLSSVPGVRSVSASNHGPLEGGNDAGGASELLRIQGQAPKAGMATMRTIVAPRFFQSLGSPLLSGRDFNDRDTEATPPVAIISANLATFLFGRESPIGRRFGMGDGETYPVEIVGVAGDVKHGSPRDQRGNVYIPFRQLPAVLRTMCLEIGTSTEPSGLNSVVRAELRRLDPSLPILRIDTVEQQLADVLVRERLVVVLATFFGAVAIVLACIGLYGLTSYNVAQRTMEIGLRMALGAAPREILWLMLRDSLGMVGLGTLVGIPAAFFATRLVKTLLFGIGNSDAITVAASVLLLTTVTALAAYVPARRAAKLDPMIALREE